MPRTSFVVPFASCETNTVDTRPLLVNQNGFDAASIGNPPASLRHIGVVGLGLIGPLKTNLTHGLRVSRTSWART